MPYQLPRPRRIDGLVPRDKEMYEDSIGLNLAFQ